MAKKTTENIIEGIRGEMKGAKAGPLGHEKSLIGPWKQMMAGGSSQLRRDVVSAIP
jgi:hypothetical protein